MPVYDGNSKAKDLYYGGTKIKEAYYNGNKVYSSGPLYYCYLDYLGIPVYTTEEVNSLGNLVTFFSNRYLYLKQKIKISGTYIWYAKDNYLKASSSMELNRSFSGTITPSQNDSIDIGGAIFNRQSQDDLYI